MSKFDGQHKCDMFVWRDYARTVRAQTPVEEKMGKRGRDSERGGGAARPQMPSQPPAHARSHPLPYETRGPQAPPRAYGEVEI